MHVTTHVPQDSTPTWPQILKFCRFCSVKPTITSRCDVPSACAVFEFVVTQLVFSLVGLVDLLQYAIKQRVQESGEMRMVFHASGKNCYIGESNSGLNTWVDGVYCWKSWDVINCLWYSLRTCMFNLICHSDLSILECRLVCLFHGLDVYVSVLPVVYMYAG